MTGPAPTPADNVPQRPARRGLGALRPPRGLEPQNEAHHQAAGRLLSTHTLERGEDEVEADLETTPAAPLASQAVPRPRQGLLGWAQKRKPLRLGGMAQRTTEASTRAVSMHSSGGDAALQLAHIPLQGQSVSQDQERVEQRSQPARERQPDATEVQAISAPIPQRNGRPHVTVQGFLRQPQDRKQCTAQPAAQHELQQDAPAGDVHSPEVSADRSKHPLQSHCSGAS